jgi:uncharacterized protein (TIGR03118 family)
MQPDLTLQPPRRGAAQRQSTARSPWRSRSSGLVSLVSLGAALGLAPSAWAQHFYQQTNLVSDEPGLAAVTHLPLVNPWGLTRSATSPWWVADNGAGVSTLYNGAGTPLSLVVTIPVGMGGTPPSAPTGTVFNGSATDFLVDTGKPARFLFVTEDGTISGWNSGATAVVKVDHTGTAVYKGVTLGQRNGANFLYAANFSAGLVEVYNAAFNPVNLGAHAFRDWFVPRGFAPFNVQNLNGMIFVTFAKQDDQKHDEVDGAGLGFVDAFDTDGNLLMRLEHGHWFNGPWGLAWAPANFGKFSNMLLVGNFGSGKIAAFDPKHGFFRGLLRGDNRRPLAIDGLWSLGFGNDASAGPSTTLYFTAGIDDEAHGLFGTITPLPDKGDGDNDADDQ